MLKQFWHETKWRLLGYALIALNAPAWALLLYLLFGGSK